jgi:hypothetical protein
MINFSSRSGALQSRVESSNLFNGQENRKAESEEAKGRKVSLFILCVSPGTAMSSPPRLCRPPSRAKAYGSGRDGKGREKKTIRPEQSRALRYSDHVSGKTNF